jgi:hypothetical protein
VPFLKNRRATPFRPRLFFLAGLEDVIRQNAAISAVDVPSQSAGDVSELICINDQ